MFDPRTANYNWPKPHPQNNPRTVDVPRQQDFADQVDGKVKAVETTAATANGAAQAVGGAAGNGNRLANGNFDAWTLGANFAASGASYEFADGWLALPGSGGGTLSAARQAFALGQTAVPGNPQYYADVTRPAAGTGNATVRAVIPKIASFEGTTQTVSLWLKGSASGTITARLDSAYGTGGSPSADVNGTSFTINLLPTWQEFRFTRTVASALGKVLGSNGDDALRLNLVWPATVLPTGTISVAHGSISRGDLTPVATDITGSRNIAADRAQRIRQRIDAQRAQVEAKYIRPDFSIVVTKPTSPYRYYHEDVEFRDDGLVIVPRNGNDYQGWVPGLRVNWIESGASTAQPSPQYEGPESAEGTPKTTIGNGLKITTANDLGDLAFDRIQWDYTLGQQIGIPDNQPTMRAYGRATTVHPYNYKVKDDGTSANNPRPINTITNAIPPVITTSVNHGFANGQRVFIYGTTGSYSTDNGIGGVVANKTEATFELRALDGTNKNGAALQGILANTPRVRTADFHVGLHHPGAKGSFRSAQLQFRHMLAPDYAETGNFGGQFEVMVAGYEQAGEPKTTTLFLPRETSNNGYLPISFNMGNPASETEFRQIKSCSLGEAMADPSRRVLYIDTVGGVTGSTHKDKVVSVATDTALVEADSGKVFTQSSAGPLVTLTLPDATAALVGVVYEVDVASTNGIKVKCVNDDKIYINGSASALAGFIKSVQDGAHLILRCTSATRWKAVVNGTWTVDA